MNKKINSGLAIGIVVAVALLAGTALWWQAVTVNDMGIISLETVGRIKEPPTDRTPVNPTAGSDRDEHGCIGSAGYSWCEAKNKCLRSWEEPCGN